MTQEIYHGSPKACYFQSPQFQATRTFLATL